MLALLGVTANMTELETRFRSDKPPSLLRSISLWCRVTSAVMAAFLLVSCGTVGDNDDPGEFWSPFNSQSTWEIGDGRILVELSGFERGHEPGKTAEFTIDIQNLREESVQLNVCARLIDEAQVVQRLHEFDISIDPEESRTRTFSVEFDEELEPRSYGLAVVVGDLGSLIHTVRVGIADDEAGPWLELDQLVCD